MKKAVLVVGLLMAAVFSSAGHCQSINEVTTFLLLEYENSSTDSDGNSIGSSNGRQSLIETVVKKTPDGTILKYDLRRDKEGKTKSGFWYFPAQVFERSDGSLELLGTDVIEKRIDQWLKKRKFPREVCGLWIHGGGFPFKFDCDPQSTLGQIEPFDLRISSMVAGAEYSHALSAVPGILKLLPAPRKGFSVVLSVDAGKVRDGEIEQALILAQMLGNELPRQQAEEDASKTGYAGSITIEFDIDDSGTITKKNRTFRNSDHTAGRRNRDQKINDNRNATDFGKGVREISELVIRFGEIAIPKSLRLHPVAVH